MIRNIGSNWVVNALQILVFMVLVPFMYEEMGNGGMGIWETINNLTGFLALLVLGVPMAGVRAIARHAASGDTEKLNEAIATCLGILLVLGGAALVVGAAMFGFFEVAYLRSDRWSDLSPGAVFDARLAFAMVLVTITFGFAAKLILGIFDAHHDFVSKNIVLACGMLLKLGLTVAFLTAKASLALIALALVLCLGAEFLACLLVLRRRHPEVHFRLRGFNRGLVRGILTFSVWAMLVNLGAQLAFRTDGAVIGLFYPSDRAGVFAQGNKVFEPLTGVILSIGIVIMPMATGLFAENRTKDLEHLLLKWSKIALSLMLAVGCYFIVLGPEFLAWFFEDEYEDIAGTVLMILMGSFVLYLPVWGVALPILMAMSRPARPAIALVVMGAVNIGLSMALARPLGLIGVALGTAIPNLFFAATALGFVFQELGTSPLEYARYVLARTVPAALVPAGLLVWLKLGVGVPAAFWPLFASGLAMLAVFGVLWAALVYRRDEHVDISPWIDRLSVWRRVRRAGP